MGCRKCWQCRERKVDDWVGRCIAESKTAVATHSITLTYGRDDGQIDHLRAAVLTYSDCQKYFKRLRKNGFPARYFAVGEYGSVKGRSHWHLIVYWLDKVPDHKLEKRFEERHWRHGFSFWENPSPASIRYVCKYIQKDIGKDERQGHLAMSKKPPLGDEYFRRLAAKHVDQGLSPQDYYYSFDEARRNGEPIKFMLGGKSADNYIRYFLHEWESRRGGFPPHSPIVDAWQDAHAPDDVELRWAGLNYHKVPVPKRPPNGGSVPVFDETRNAFCSQTPSGRLWYSYDAEGNVGWHRKIKPDLDLERERIVAYRNASRGS